MSASICACFSLGAPFILLNNWLPFFSTCCATLPRRGGAFLDTICSPFFAISFTTLLPVLLNSLAAVFSTASFDSPPILPVPPVIPIKPNSSPIPIDCFCSFVNVFPPKYDLAPACASFVGARKSIIVPGISLITSLALT